MEIWKALKTEVAYQKALNRTVEIFHVEDGTPEADELDLLLILIKDYEDKHFQVPLPDPIEAIKLKMKEKGMKQKDLEPLIGSKGHVSAILSGKRSLTLEMVKKLHQVLGIPAEIFLA